MRRRRAEDRDLERAMDVAASHTLFLLGCLGAAIEEYDGLERQAAAAGFNYKAKVPAGVLRTARAAMTYVDERLAEGQAM